MANSDLFDGLTHVVQYRRKDGGGWNTMSAYDSERIADNYAKDCSIDGEGNPWEYRVVPVNNEIGD